MSECACVCVRYVCMCAGVWCVVGECQRVGTYVCER